MRREQHRMSFSEHFSVYQGLSEKHDDIRRELKPLLTDPTVTDEVLLR